MTVNEAINHISKLSDEERKALNDKSNWIIFNEISRVHCTYEICENIYREGLLERGNIFRIIEVENCILKEKDLNKIKRWKLYLSGLTETAFEILRYNK